MSKSDSVHFSKVMLRSEPYLKLSGSSIKVLNFFFMKRQMKKTNPRRSSEWSIINNGEIVFTYGEAVKLGFTRPKFQRAIDQLVMFGFIDIEHRGGGLMGDFSKYSISSRWKLHGQDGFINKNRPKDTRGFGFKSK